VAETPEQQADQARGVLLIVVGGAAFLGGLTLEDQRIGKSLQVGGLAAAGVGLYYLIFKGLFGRDAETGKTGGLVGVAEDVLVGSLPPETSTPTPTVNQPPAPGVPTLPEIIPYTGRVHSPARDSTIPTLFGRDFYVMELEVTNNTHEPVTGLLEIHVDETGTFGGEETIVETEPGVTLQPGETRVFRKNVRSSAGFGTWSDCLTTVSFAGHHITTLTYTVR
jgi:hypothetical protein